MNTARKLILISASLPLFAAPAASFADGAAAMDACINAFVNTNLPKDRKVLLRKLETVYTTIDSNRRTYEISLKATGVDSGKRFASATCIADRKGTVIALNGRTVATTLANAKQPAKATLTNR